jgi:hypothetical protein
MTWSPDGTARGTGNDPYLIFGLERAAWVYAVRVKYAFEDTAPPAQLQAYWKRAGQEFTETERFFETRLPADPEEQQVVGQAFKASGGGRWVKPRKDGPVTWFWVTVPVNDSIDQFRLDPDNKSCVFKIAEVRLVVGAGADGRPGVQLPDSGSWASRRP